jgi:hypothetical protein
MLALPKYETSLHTYWKYFCKSKNIYKESITGKLQYSNYRNFKNFNEELFHIHRKENKYCQDINSFQHGVSIQPISVKTLASILSVY